MISYYFYQDLNYHQGNILYKNTKEEWDKFQCKHFWEASNFILIPDPYRTSVKNGVAYAYSVTLRPTINQWGDIR